MPSLPTRNGNFNYYYKSDEFTHSFIRSIVRFIWLSLCITLCGTLYASWWLTANYLYFNDRSLFDRLYLDYVVPMLSKLCILSLYTMMLVLITSSIRPYRVMHRLLFHRNLKVLLFLISAILMMAISLEIPHWISSRSTFDASSSLLGLGADTAALWCSDDDDDDGECPPFWSLSRITDWYLCGALCPFLLFVVWWVLEFCVLGRICSEYRVIGVGRKKSSDHLQMSLLSAERNHSINLELIQSYLDREESAQTRTYSTTFSAAFCLILTAFWLCIQTMEWVQTLHFFKDRFLAIYALFLSLCVGFKFVLKSIGQRLGMVIQHIFAFDD